MTAAEFLIGITVWAALLGAGFGGRWLLRHVLDPAVQEGITRSAAAAARLSRGLSSGPPGADRAPTPRPTGSLAAPTAQPRPVALG